MSLDPNKTYLVWNGTEFPNSTSATFKAPAGSTIDWGDGTVETFDAASTTVNTHTYTDGKTEHTIAISGLTSIDNSAFRGCRSLTSVTIPEGITSIGNDAFNNCTNLTNVSIPNSVTSFGDYVFNSCNNLQYNVKDNLKYLGNSENPYIYLGNNSEADITTANIDSHCRFISSYAFYNCSGLTSVTIPDIVTRIGSYAFKNCGSLTSIIIPDSVTSIGGYAFLECTSLKSLKLGNGLTSVGFYAFQKCNSLTNVEIPKSLKVITNGMFHSCSNLTSVIIPEGVESIEQNTFSYCEKLTCVVIPESITGIGKNAFENCTNLNSIIIFNTTPPTLGSWAIPNNVQFIYVLQSSKEAYKGDTNWTSLSSKIVSDNVYLSFVRFNQKNKEYIAGKVIEAEQYADDKSNELNLELDSLSNDIDTAMSIAKGRATGYVFDTKDDMDAWLENAENVSNLVLGDNLYIRAVDTPDYWWDGSSAQMLETQKVDLTNYVKFTDYATKEKAGVSKINGFGLVINGNGVLEIYQASKFDIDKKENLYNPITPYMLNYAVKVGITNNTETLTEEEKASACEWLGAVKQHNPTKKNSYWLYGVQCLADGSIVQGIRQTSATRKVDCIPIYGVNGQLQVGDPSADYHATSKKYVDDSLDNKLSKPTTPTEDSAVILNADGTASTKALSELGGKLYRHVIHISYTKNEEMVNISLEMVFNNVSDAFTSLGSLYPESIIANGFVCCVGGGYINGSVTHDGPPNCWTTSEILYGYIHLVAVNDDGSIDQLHEIWQDIVYSYSDVTFSDAVTEI